MTDETYKKILEINPEFDKKDSVLGRSFRYAHKLASERSGKPSGKGLDDKGNPLMHPKYDPEKTALNVAQGLHDEMEKLKRDPNYRPQFNEGAQFATKGRPTGPNAPSAPKGDVSEAEREGYIKRVDAPYKNVDETNKFLAKQGVETIPKVVDNSPEGKSTLADIASQGMPIIGGARNLASKIAPSKVSPTKSQVSYVNRQYPNFVDTDQDPEKFGVPATNIYYNERPQYEKEMERPISGPEALKFPMQGRKSKSGVDPKSTSMVTPPIGNGTAMPGSESGISKNQFARNDAEEEMKKKARPLKFNSLIS